jgi:DNA modification methylase
MSDSIKTTPIVVLFRACYGAARITEFQSVFESSYPKLSCKLNWNDKLLRYNGGDYGPDVVQYLPPILSPNEWALIASKCISCRGVFRVLGEGESIEQCITMVGTLTDEEILHYIYDTWSIHIKMLGKSDRLHPDIRTERIESFKHVLAILHKRKVVLNNPTCELWLLEDHRHEYDEYPDINRPPKYQWLLLQIPCPEKTTARQIVDRSVIRKRPFIHTTTLPSDLSLLMTNLGKVDNNSTVLDPFCGSGSLLLTCAMLGAKTIGSDIDTELLSSTPRKLFTKPTPSRPKRGTEEVCIYDSFRELNVLEPILLAGFDIQQNDAVKKLRKANENKYYDAIITDPPYGIRESQSQLSNDELHEFLFLIASTLLCKGGRLVFLFPFECTLENVYQVQKDLTVKYKTQCIKSNLEFITLSLERFNSRLFRATIVLENQ